MQRISFASMPGIIFSSTKVIISRVKQKTRGLFYASPPLSFILVMIKNIPTQIGLFVNLFIACEDILWNIKISLFKSSINTPKGLYNPGNPIFE